MRTRTIYDKNGDIKAEFKNGECVFWAGEQEAEKGESSMVIPDIAPFVANTGEYIAGRNAWRKHLKKVDGIEMGASDLKAQERQWKQRKEAHRERLTRAAGVVNTMPQGSVMQSKIDHSRLQVEMANKLHGRPIPERKELIKLTLDTAKRFHKR